MWKKTTFFIPLDTSGGELVLCSDSGVFKSRSRMVELAKCEEKVTLANISHKQAITFAILQGI